MISDVEIVPCSRPRTNTPIGLARTSEPATPSATTSARRRRDEATPLMVSPLSPLPRRTASTHREGNRLSTPHGGQGDQPAPDMLHGGWYTTEELAHLLGVDPSTVRRWRTARPAQGPPFVQLSSRVIMYSALDVQRWLENRRVDPEVAA